MKTIPQQQVILTTDVQAIASLVADAVKERTAELEKVLTNEVSSQRLLSVSEAATFLDVHESTLRSWINTGAKQANGTMLKLAAFRVDNVMRIRVSDLLAFGSLK